jgi:hypothetical protein
MGKWGNALTITPNRKGNTEPLEAKDIQHASKQTVEKNRANCNKFQQFRSAHERHSSFRKHFHTLVQPRTNQKQKGCANGCQQVKPKGTTNHVNVVSNCRPAAKTRTESSCECSQFLNVVVPNVSRNACPVQDVPVHINLKGSKKTAKANIFGPNPIPTRCSLFNGTIRNVQQLKKRHNSHECRCAKVEKAHDSTHSVVLSCITKVRVSEQEWGTDFLLIQKDDGHQRTNDKKRWD